MPVPERRFAMQHPVRVETRADGGRMIVGYASVFYRQGDPGTEYELWTNVVERVLPGAFDRAIRENQDVRGLFNHRSDNVLGRTKSGTLRLSVDNIGLRYEIDVAETTLAKDLVVTLERGDVSGSSFSFIIVSENWRKEDRREIREIVDVDLFDVGPVTYPAYEATTSGARSGDEMTEARTSYDAWRSAEVQNAASRRARDLRLRELEASL